MSTLKVDALHSEDGGSSNIELDDSRNTTCKGNLTVDGTTTLTGAVELPNDTVDIADLSATGTASSSTYLRGDNSWAAISAGVDGIATSADATGLTIDSSERFNYGYATSIPAFGHNARVQICGQDDDSTTLSLIRSEDGTDPARLVFGRSRGSNASPTVVNNATHVGHLVWAVNDGNDWTSDIIRIEGKVQPGAGIGQDDVAGDLKIFMAKDGGNATCQDIWNFVNNGAFRMRIGDSDNYSDIDNQSTASVTAYQLKGDGTCTFSSSESNGNWMIAEFTGGSGKTYFTGHGHAWNTGNSWGGSSDEKVKKDITDAPSQWNDVKALRVRNFKFIPEHSGEDTKMIGLVAQEAETVCPHLIENPKKRDGSDDPDGVKGLKYSVLYMKAFKALQEAMARIETLETKVATLEAG